MCCCTAIQNFFSDRPIRVRFIWTTENTRIRNKAPILCYVLSPRPTAYALLLDTVHISTALAYHQRLRNRAHRGLQPPHLPHSSAPHPVLYSCLRQPARRPRPLITIHAQFRDTLLASNGVVSWQRNSPTSVPRVPSLRPLLFHTYIAYLTH